MRDSDATLILRPAGSEGGDPGTEWAIRCAERYGRPLLVCDPGDPSAASVITHWLAELPIQTLNVAGPSEATAPGIGNLAHSVLKAASRSLAGMDEEIDRAWLDEAEGRDSEMGDDPGGGIPAEEVFREARAKLE